MPEAPTIHGIGHNVKRKEDPRFLRETPSTLPRSGLQDRGADKFRMARDPGATRKVPYFDQ